MASFNAHFNRIFKEKLSSYGFLKLKGLNAFGRLVNGELLQYIILYNRSSLVKGKKAFTVVTGVLSIYSFSDRSYDKYDFFNCGVTMAKIAPGRKPEQDGNYRSVEELHWVNYEFLYDASDDNDMIAVIGECSGCIEQYVLPLFEGIRNLEEYVEYCKEYKSYVLRGADKMLSNDALLLVMLDDHDDFVWLYEKSCETLLSSSYDGNKESDDYKRNEAILYEAIINDTAKARDKVYADPELYKMAIEKLESNKQTGEKMFKHLGISI